MKAYFIFYVKDQAKSAGFYSKTLTLEPSLNVPGMTEFTLSDGCVLGLMPASGIKKLLGEALPGSPPPAGFPKAELYLVVDDPLAYHRRALQSGAKELSGLAERDWGHRAAYCLDPDGHVLAFAEEI